MVASQELFSWVESHTLGLSITMSEVDTTDEQGIANNKDIRLYGRYEVTALDGEGNVLQTEVIEDAGAFSIEDIYQNALVHHIDELQIEPITIEVRRGDEVIHCIERDDERIDDE